MRVTASIICLCILAACGTAYKSPELTGERLATAEAVLQHEESRSAAGAPEFDPDAAAWNFLEVVERVEPVAEEFCHEQKPDDLTFPCDVQVVVDERTDVQPNAFQYFDKAGQPTIKFNLPFIARARNQDELAFVFGHEMGHLLGEHIEKQRKQQVAGAVIMGALMGLSQAAASYGNPYRSTVNDQRDMYNAMIAGKRVDALGPVPGHRDIAWSEVAGTGRAKYGAAVVGRAGLSSTTARS